MEKQLFGTLPTGEQVYAYTLTNNVASVTFITRGATIADFTVFGTSIVGGFEDLATYLLDTSHQGAIVGRVANRIGNASFTMDGKTYEVTKNNLGKHCLHGGKGFDVRLFTVTRTTENSVTFAYTSQDGEEGFPNRLHLEVTYTLNDSSLQIDYTATPEGKTPIILTNHAYFHLDGFGGTIYNHSAQIFADTYTEVDGEQIPTGKHLPVKDTPLDLNTPTRLGERINATFKGYDTYYQTKPQAYKLCNGKNLGLVAKVDNGNLQMRVYTDQPGLQFYTANTMGKGPDFKGGIKKINHGAFCLETQTEPDCISHGKEFYSAGETYTQSTVYEIIKL